MSIERAETMLDFPMPNDTLAGGTVVASTYYTDEIALVLILNPNEPYFTVYHYYMADTESEFGGPPIKAGELLVLTETENIVPAVREYEQSGGDY